ncbi:MAG: FAD-binding protein, partial [Candidatus Marinimicrobia bacterium]|nr:FAD-binding protein [Candidatus Neomarinimicrobiota bacterium]
ADLNKSTQMLREALKRADSEGLKLMPMGARHSMGKQAFVQNAILLDTLKMNGMSMDGDFLRVQAGARWFEVIEFVKPVVKRDEIIKPAFVFTKRNTRSTIEGIESIKSIVPIKTKTIIENIIASFNS